MRALLGRAAVQLAGQAALESAVEPRVRLNGGQGLLTVGGFGAGGQGGRLRKLAGGMPTWLMELAWPGIFQAWALLTIV